MKTGAIRIHEYGDPSVLRWEAIEVPDPAPGEARIRQAAVGLNFIDVYHRTGLYPVGALPSGLGLEGAGVVEAVGDEVEGVRPGDRVAYVGGPLGAYAAVRNVPAARLVKLPDSLPANQAAGIMLRGMTAEYLLRRTYPVQAGETILVHAAAGGVGLILCQWASHLGARVIGTVGSEEKAELARAHGCHHPVVYTREDFVARVRELTDGAGVSVVYDSVGQATFMGSLDCLRPRGYMVSFGQSSGPVEPLNIGVLGQARSLFLTRPSIAAYTAVREELLASAQALFDVVAGGAVKIEVNQSFPLEDAAEAHRALESRRTTGASVLIVS